MQPSDYLQIQHIIRHREHVSGSRLKHARRMYNGLLAGGGVRKGLSGGGFPVDLDSKEYDIHGLLNAIHDQDKAKWDRDIKTATDTITDKKNDNLKIESTSGVKVLTFTNPTYEYITLEGKGTDETILNTSITVTTGVSLTLKKLKILHNNGHVIKVNGGGQCTIRECTIHDSGAKHTKPLVQVEDFGYCRIELCEIDNKECNLETGTGSTVMTVKGPNAKLTIDDCTVKGSVIHAENNARLTVKDTYIHPIKQKPTGYEKWYQPDIVAENSLLELINVSYVDKNKKEHDLADMTPKKPILGDWNYTNQNVRTMFDKFVEGT